MIIGIDGDDVIIGGDGSDILRGDNIDINDAAYAACELALQSLMLDNAVTF